MAKMIDYQKNNIGIAVLGKRGSGKTVLTEVLFNNLVRKAPVYVYDIVHNFDYRMARYRSLPPIFRENAKHYMQLRELVDREIYIPENEFIKKRIYVLREENPRDLQVFLRHVFNIYKRRRNLNCYVVIDEVYMNVTNATLDSAENEFLKKIVVVGRNYGIGYVVTSQRPALMNKTILSQSDYVFCFKMHQPHDIKALKEYFNVNQFKALQKHEFLRYENDSGNVCAFKPIKLETSVPRLVIKRKVNQDAT